MTAPTTPRTRHEFRDLHAATTPADVAFALELASTPGEVDAAAHLSLVLFDVAGTQSPFTEHGRAWPSLQELVHTARRRVDGFPPSLRETSERLNEITAAATRRRKAEAKAAAQARDTRIARVGINNAEPARTTTTRGTR